MDWQSLFFFLQDMKMICGCTIAIGIFVLVLAVIIIERLERWK